MKVNSTIRNFYKFYIKENIATLLY